MDEKVIRDVILSTVEATLDAQLKAVKKLRQGKEEQKPSRQGMSQIDMVYDILKRADKELHITEIINRIEAVHGVRLERESIVSALTKKIKKGDRFTRTDKNTYVLIKG